MKEYQNLMRRILSEGVDKEDRTGTGTRSVFGHQMRFDLTQGFPLVTTKRVFWRGVVEELLWFLSGSTSIKPLVEKGVGIWTEWPLAAFNKAMLRDNFDGADRQMSKEEFESHIVGTPGFDEQYGDLGPVYSKQWRSWPTYNSHYGWEGIDQISGVIEQLRTTPDSRRMIVTAWNPAEIDDMALPPCHMMFQFYTRPMTVEQREAAMGGVGRPLGLGTPTHALFDEMGVPTRFVDLQLYQRSADVFLGVPFNIASYALLLTLIAREVGMVPGEFVHTLGDAHLYHNHLEQARLQLTREPRPLPQLMISDRANGIFDMRYHDFHLDGYEPYPPIKAPVAV